MLTSRFGFGYGMGYAAYKEVVALVSLGHSVTVVHCYSSPDIAQFYDKKITVIYLPIKNIPLIGFIFFFFKLKNFFKEKINLEKFDSIYIQSLEFGLLDMARINTPIFYFARSSMIGLQNVLRSEGVKISSLAKVIHLVLVTLERRCMRYSKMIFVKSRKMVSEISTLYGINLNKIKIIAGGIDTNDFQIQKKSSCEEFKRKLRIPQDSYIVLYAGRIVPQKGLIYLIEASLCLLREFNFIIVIAGANLSESYKKKVKNLLDKNIYQKHFYFLGHVKQRDMSLILNLADCIVTPSLYEPFGMVNLQAAFLGKKIITTDVVGSIDLLANYRNMKIIKAGSATAIALALKEELLLRPQNNLLPLDSSTYSWKSVAEELSLYFSFTS